jgi:hypothetical protein
LHLLMQNLPCSVKAMQSLETVFRFSNLRTSKATPSNERSSSKSLKSLLLSRSQYVSRAFCLASSQPSVPALPDVAPPWSRSDVRPSGCWSRASIWHRTSSPWFEPHKLHEVFCFCYKYLSTTCTHCTDLCTKSVCQRSCSCKLHQ